MNTLKQKIIFLVLFFLSVNSAYAYKYAWTMTPIPEELFNHERFSMVKEPLVINLGNQKSISIDPNVSCSASRHTRTHPGGINECGYRIDFLYIEGNSSSGKGSLIKTKIVFTKSVSSKIINYLTKVLLVPLSHFDSNGSLKCTSGACTMTNELLDPKYTGSVFLPEDLSLLTGDLRDQLLKMEGQKKKNGVSEFVNKLAENSIKIDIFRAFTYTLGDASEYGGAIMKISSKASHIPSYIFTPYLERAPYSIYYNLLKLEYGTLEGDLVVFNLGEGDDVRRIAIHPSIIENTDRPYYGLELLDPATKKKIGESNLY